MGANALHAPVPRGARRPSKDDNITSLDWRRALRKSGERYAGDEANILRAMRTAPELTGLVRFNEFSLAVEITRDTPWRALAAGAAWTETDDSALTVWLQERELSVRSRAVVADTVALAARDRTHHPVRNFLETVYETWDSQPRLRSWLATYLRASGESAYLSAIGRRFLVSAVARVMQPGCQADHVLVLEGRQGAGKTTVARILASRPDWFAGSLPDIHSKDAMLQLAGKWIVEIAELRAIRASQLEATKAFLSQCVDTFRPPFGRRTAQVPRQCVFIATTNESAYLHDRTGNRRYWPVRCGDIDLAALRRDVTMLWAEAVHEFRCGTAWHLSPEEAALATGAQRERLHTSELELDVAAYLARIHDSETTVRDVLIHGLHLDPDKPTYTETARKLGTAVADAMELAGWHKVGRVGADRRTRYRRAAGVATPSSPRLSGSQLAEPYQGDKGDKVYGH